MAKYGPDDFSISVDNSGGSPVVMDAYVDELDGMDVEAIIEESHSFGDTWVENLYSGIRKGNPFTIGGFYDDTATTGPDAIFNSLGDTRTVTVTWGGSKTTAFECILTKYVRVPGRNQSTRYSVTLTPTGAGTEA